MNLKKTILLLYCVLFFVPAFAQSSIDYQPKALFKALQKTGVAGKTALKEVLLTGSTSSQQIFQGKFFQIETKNVFLYKYIYVGRVKSCRAGGCSVTHNETNNGNSEYFDYYILFDTNKTVQAVKVFNYQASHGQEVTAKGWLKQFIGYNGSVPLEVEKNIDAISGATISVYAITFDVEMKTRILQNLM